MKKGALASNLVRRENNFNKYVYTYFQFENMYIHINNMYMSVSFILKENDNIGLVQAVVLI